MNTLLIKNASHISTMDDSNTELKNKSICHHCSFERNLETECKLKKKCEFVMYGPGVEKVFDELKEKFPNKKISIFSSDYLKKKI